MSSIGFQKFREQLRKFFVSLRLSFASSLLLDLEISKKYKSQKKKKKKKKTNKPTNKQTNKHNNNKVDRFDFLGNPFLFFDFPMKKKKEDIHEARGIDAIKREFLGQWILLQNSPRETYLPVFVLHYAPNNGASLYQGRQFRLWWKSRVWPATVGLAPV